MVFFSRRRAWSCLFGITFAQPFNASSNSRLFRMAEDIGFKNNGPLGVLSVKIRMWPLLEAKCGEQYNHRYGTYEDANRSTREKKNAGAPTTPVSRLRSADVVSVPRYWVSRDDATSTGCGGPSCWQLLYRFSAYPDNERTMISWIAPQFPSTHITPRIIFPTADRKPDAYQRASQYALLLAAMNSSVSIFCCDEECPARELTSSF